MGFCTRIPAAAPPPPQFTDPPLTSEVEKKYFILDKIDINYVTVNDKEDINLVVTLNMYNSYEERLVRGNLLTSMEFSIQGLIDKNFSENLWSKCYVKIKELVLNQNTESLKKALTLREREENPTSGSIITDPNTGIETETILSDDLTDNENTLDTIPTQYQYLLEIDDHFN